jgi:hypothetical protein
VIVSTKKLDAVKLAAFCRGLGILPGIAEREASALCAKNFAFTPCKAGRVRRLPKSDAKVNHGLRQFLRLIDSLSNLSPRPDPQKSLLNTPVFCADY